MRLKKFIKELTICVIAIISLGRCATINSPQGGPIDSLAPRLIASGPMPYSLNFQGDKIVLVFDEYIKLENQQKEFFSSPSMATAPILTVKGKTIEVRIEDTLQPSTTYRLWFGNSIVDNNEGNVLRDFGFTFSTGDTIDDNIITGQTFDALTKDTIIESFVMFFDPAADSTVADSVLQTALAQVMVRSDSSGVFVADILKDKPYLIYALGDKNDNQRYEAGEDYVGFLDTTYSPSQMGDVLISYDSLERKWEILNPQLRFNMFVEESPKAQTILENKRDGKLKMQVVFNRKGAQVDTLEFKNIPTEIVTRVWNKDRDTLSLWIAPRTQGELDSLPSHIDAHISYLREDSLKQMKPFSDDITFAQAGAVVMKMSAEDSVREENYRIWKEAKDAKRMARLEKKGKLVKDSLRQEKQRVEDSIKNEKRIADSLAMYGQQQNPFQLKVNSGAEFVPRGDLIFDFEYPLRRFDKDSVSLMVVDVASETQGGGRAAAQEAQEAKPAEFELFQDSLIPTRWHLKRPWVAGQKYELSILKGAIENTAFQTNDTLQSTFTVASKESFGIFKFNVTSSSSVAHDQGQYLIQLVKATSKEDDPPLHEFIYDPSEGSMQYILDYLDTGEYKIRIVADVNSNGQWDTGSLIHRRQPEEVELWSKDGEQTIVTKENWEVIIDINIDDIFNTPQSLEQ